MNITIVFSIFELGTSCHLKQRCFWPNLPKEGRKKIVYRHKLRIPKCVIYLKIHLLKKKKKIIKYGQFSRYFNISSPVGRKDINVLCIWNLIESVSIFDTCTRCKWPQYRILLHINLAKIYKALPLSSSTGQYPIKGYHLNLYHEF